MKEILLLLQSINERLEAILKAMEDEHNTELDRLAEALHPRLKKLSMVFTPT